MRLASAIRPEWLRDLSGVFEEKTVRSWDAERELVVAEARTIWNGFTLAEREVPAAADDETAAILLERALADPSRALDLGEDLDALLARVAFLVGAMPELASRSFAPSRSFRSRWRGSTTASAARSRTKRPRASWCRRDGLFPSGTRRAAPPSSR